MPVVQARDGSSVILDPFWQAVKARAASAEVKRFLNGGAVYLGYEDYSRDERADAEPWGRVVILPTTTLWPLGEVDSDRAQWSWLFRAEMRAPVLKPGAPPYNPALPLEKLQQMLGDLFNGWSDTPAALGVVLRQPVWRQRRWQGVPEYDPDRRMWWNSSEYRGEGSRPVS